MARLSPTYDEAANVEFGRSVLERRPGTVPMQKMAISALNSLPARWLDTFGVDVSADTRLFLSRLPTALASLVLGVLVFVWSNKLYGLRGALLSSTLYALCPSILAHASLATNDLYCACLMFASVMLFLRYLAAPTLASLTLWAIVTGAAQVTKHTALLLFPLFAALWAVDAARARRRADPAAMPTRAGWVTRGVAHGALAVLVILVVVNAAYLFRDSRAPTREYLAAYHRWPAEVRDRPILASVASLASHVADVPVPLPAAYVHAFLRGIHYNTTGAGHGPVYLLGQLDQRGWSYYFGVALALKMPLAVLLLLVAAALVSGRFMRKNPLDEIALVLTAFTLFAFFSFACTAQIGIRYLLPLLPFVYVAIGKVAAHVPARHPTFYRAAVCTLVLWAAVSVLSFHPHYLSYFNELIGDRKNMYKYLADSNVDWGQNAYDLDRYLAANRGRPVAVNPESVVGGRVIVNVNSLVGVLAPVARYQWLREGFEPVDHIGYAWLVYDVPHR